MKILPQVVEAKNVHVLGVAGQEGRAVFDYLLSLGANVFGHVSIPENGFKETFLTFSDAYEEKEAIEMAEKFINSQKIIFGSNYGKNIQEGDVVIVPQAYRRLSLNAPIIEMAKNEKIKLFQAIEIAFDIAKCVIIGATGTAGKSTVSAIISNILQCAGVPFYFSGNDRENKWDFFALEKIPSNGFALFEISHRHLMNLKQSPNIAVITNIFPHHLDDAGSYENYIAIKQNIYCAQDEKDVVILNQSLIDSQIIKQNDKFRGKAFFYKGGELGASYNNHLIKINNNDFKLSGDHNIQNANAAILACLAANIKESVIVEGIKSFNGLKYRQEIVGEYNGVKIINDGKSTDPLAAIEAVKAIPNIGALILGGIREGFEKRDFIVLGEVILDKKIKNVFLFGTSKENISEDLSSLGVPFIICNSLEDVIIEAKKRVKSGESIVFSPGCQSFDEFKDYRHRAVSFNLAIKKIFE